MSEPTPFLSVFQRECCPHCKGTGGFIYKLTIQGLQFQPWQNTEGSPDFESLSGKHGAYRCTDCGKIIRQTDP